MTSNSTEGKNNGVMVSVKLKVKAEQVEGQARRAGIVGKLVRTERKVPSLI